MYQGSNKTALASQTQIANALVSLMGTMPYTQISICQICREAEISRQTFYSLFSSKEKVITYELERNYGLDLECSCHITGLTLEDIACIYSHYFTEHREFLRLLVENDIIECMTDTLRCAFFSCEYFMPRLPEKKRSYLAYYLAGALTSIAQCYVKYGEDTDEDQLREIISSLLGGEMIS